jgi:hypothetical protein
MSLVRLTIVAVSDDTPKEILKASFPIYNVSLYRVTQCSIPVLVRDTNQRRVTAERLARARKKSYGIF